MDEHPFPGDEAGEDWTARLLVFGIFVLSLFATVMSLMLWAQTGPSVGEIIVFDPHGGPRYWDQAGLPVTRTEPAGGQQGRCFLMPAIMAAEGGSLVLEAKETTLPASYRVHWAGGRTDRGRGDCGVSADLTLQLAQVRSLVVVAGGWGLTHRLWTF